MRRKIIPLFLIILICISMLSKKVQVYAADLSYTTDAEFTFTDNGITETKSSRGYTIDGTCLTIQAAGVYSIGGSCSSGNIEVSKGLSDVTLVLDNLNLTSTTGAPVLVKKNTSASIHLEGTSTLTDGENADDETSTDETVSGAFEGAAVKVKSGATVTFCGNGSLNIEANAKNGIKGASEASIIFNQSGTITISGSGKYYAGTRSGAAANHGIACDGSLEFNQGSYIIKAANDGIKSTPDATDASEGTTIDTASAGTVTIHGGSFDIDVDGDGIQADSKLVVYDGSFDICTYKGYGTWNDSLADALSCKGLKASGDRATEAGIDPRILISGGSFVLNTADDAIHSDAYAEVTGGSFTIKTGDDGMHADTSLILGTEGSTVARDPDVRIETSYEGLEGGTVYIYNGRYYVVASDDGVNAAGGSSNGTSADQFGRDGFNPGGGRPGSTGSQNSSSDYNIYMKGGSLFVYCNGDGLDSNGGLYLTGGTQEVFSQSSGDNSAIDADGTISIRGAVIFTAGTNPQMDPVSSSWFGSGQKYKTYSSNLSSGRIVNATLGGTVLYSTKLTKSASFFMYSAPLSSTPSITTGTSLTACKGGSHSHSWDSGSQTKAASSTEEGEITYTCSKCSATETQTIPASSAVTACNHEASGEESTDEVYTITFEKDDGVASIDVYHTQDYTSASEENVTTAVARDADTGDPLVSGSGQVNFKVNLLDGYQISSVTGSSGYYKNIKTLEDNIYRFTKITGDMTISICTEASASEESSEEENSSTTDTDETDTSESGTDDASETAAAETTASGRGSDGTAYGKGASFDTANKAITSLKSDKDPAGTKYAPIRLQSKKQSRNSIKLVWAKVSGASKYVLYGNQCGSSKQLSKIKTLTKRTITVKKTASGKITKGKYYKFMVLALDSHNKVVSCSRIIHVASAGGKIGNYKKLTIKARVNQSGKSISSYKRLSATRLKKGKSLKLKVTGTKQTKNTTIKKHRPISYESTNPNVAAVSSGGKVTGKSKGSCYIWAYAQNGPGKRIKITVK